MFKEKDLLRILTTIDRDLAIGVIIRAEQLLNVRTENEVTQLVDAIVAVFTDWIPEPFNTFIESSIPDFFRALRVYIAAMVYNYLNLLPGEQLFLTPPDDQLEYTEPEPDVDWEEQYKLLSEEFKQLENDYKLLEKALEQAQVQNDLVRYYLQTEIDKGIKNRNRIRDRYGVNSKQYAQINGWVNALQSFKNRYYP